jgi:hypothetical protein
LPWTMPKTRNRLARPATSDRPIFDGQSRHATKITAIAGHHGCSKLLGNRRDPQIVVLYIQFGANEQIELRPSLNSHGSDGETIPGNNKGRKYGGLLMGLRSFRSTSQCRPAADLLFQGNRAHAQLIRRMAIDGGKNLGVIALMEAEHIRVKKETRLGSLGLVGAGAIQIFALSTVGVDGRQPGVE